MEQKDFHFTPLSIKGCYKIKPPIYSDNRGLFIKNFQCSRFYKKDLHFDFKEEFFSISKKGTIRGLHFQNPPHAMSKIVFCISGEIFDVLIDLRRNSPTFLRTECIFLNSKDFTTLFIPEGIAHGFQSLKDHSIMMYKTSSEYNPDSDSGIHWTSINVNWPIQENLLISQRDQNFLKLTEFQSPFN
jgi:dTDP-4-dehydrorhamnose 3,5-epimerase